VAKQGGSPQERAKGLGSPMRGLLAKRALAVSNRRDRERPNLDPELHDVIQSHRIDISEIARVLLDIIKALAKLGILAAEGGGGGGPGPEGPQGIEGPEGPEGPRGPKGDEICCEPPIHPGGPKTDPGGQYSSTNDNPNLARDGVPTTKPNWVEDAQDWAEPVTMVVPRWGNGTTLPTSWPGRLHFLWGEGNIPRVYLGDYVAGTPPAFTSTLRVPTGRFAREPNAGVHGSGPTPEKGVVFLNDTGNRLMFYRGASTISTVYRKPITFSGSGAISGAAALAFGGLAAATHRGYIAPFGGLIKQITAQRTSGTSGGEILIISSNGSVETTLATVAFTTSAKTLNIASAGLGWLGISAGAIIYAKVPAGETERNITVTIETEDTD
jgi:hypothetical protein